MRRTITLAVGIVAAIGVTGAVAAEHQAVVAKKKKAVVKDPRGDSDLPACDITKVTVKQQGKKKSKAKLQFKIELAGERGGKENITPPKVNLKIGAVRDVVDPLDETLGTVKVKDQPLDQTTYTFKAKDFGISKKFKWQVDQCTERGGSSDDYAPNKGMKKGKLRK